MKPNKLRTLWKVVKENKFLTRNTTVAATEEKLHLKPFSDIPGPSSLPIIGPTLHFLPGGTLYHNDGFELLDKLYKNFGPICRVDGMFGSPGFVFLFDAESSARILRAENWNPVRPGFESLEYFRKIRNKTKEQALEPTGLITDHGDAWRQFRSKVNPAMMHPTRMALYTPVLDEVSNDMVNRMKSQRDENNMLKGKFNDEMNLWALESIGIVALGRRLNCFDPNLAIDSPERRLIQLVHDIFKIANDLDFKPSLWRYFSTRTYRKAIKMFQEQEDLTKYFVKMAMKELEETKGNPKSEDEKGVLEKLLEIDEKVAIIMACDMLFAGVDTAANTMTGLFYLLAINPEKQNKLREELLSGSEKTPYLKACVKEGLRMMPVVAGNLRVTTKDYEVLGYMIPEGKHVTFSHQYMSRMECHFPRPNEFIPERFTVDKSDSLHYSKAHPFSMSPFGFGARSCIGRRIAVLEAEVLLKRVIENFHIEWFGPPLTFKSTSLNYASPPFNFRFIDVKH